MPAAFGRLCVETAKVYKPVADTMYQPPSGGCVLKHERAKRRLEQDDPAAFGRLCVETVGSADNRLAGLPAAFGRLCVET